MYALENIKKFVDDHAEFIGCRAAEIIKRAEELSFNGVVSGGSIGAIMDDG